ncbi:MAG: DUF4115 domain-containing protein [Acidobacteria bacterium]|nr:DUF4115 domain-containing protein [Acidobacteriota bacterium]
MSERVREAREARGLSHRQIADATKLSVRVVMALENGRHGDLPSGIYRRSIVRAVAHEVGLNPEATLRAFLEEVPDDLPAPGQVSVTVAATPARRPMLKRVLAVFGATIPLLAGVAYFGQVGTWRHQDTPAPHREARPSLPADAAAAGGLETVVTHTGGPVVMSISVSDRCELRIFADGVIVVGRVLEAGESLRVPFSDAVELSGDNAGVVQFSINGQSGRMLGDAGEPLSARITRDDYPSFLSRS